MSTIYEAMSPGGHETYATSIFSKIKTYLDSNPYKPVKDIPNTPTAIATFTDGSDLPMPKLEVAIEPQQDLHGYDSPWVGGSGKNKLPMTVESIKSKNTAGTWNNNVYTKNDMSFEILTDGANNVTGIKVNGTKNVSSPVYFTIGSFDFAANESYKVNGGVDLPSPIPVYFAVNGGVVVASSADYTQTFTSDTTKDVIIVVERTQQINNVIFHPMIRLSTEQDSSFAPYSNICPISGWDEVNVTRTGKNLFGGIDFANAIKDSSPSGEIDYENETVQYSYGTGDKTTIYSDFKPNTAYTFMLKIADCSGLNFSMRLIYTDGTNTPIKVNTSDIGKYITITSNPNKSIGKLSVMWYQSTKVKLKYNECGIFEGALTADDFEPYNGQTYNIQFKDGDNPLTVYGGTLDVVSGVQTVDRVGVDMGDLNWTYANGFFRTLDLNSTIKRPANNYAIVNAISSMYKAESWNAISGTSNGKFAVSIGTSDPLIVCNTDYTDATTFKSAMSGVQLVYELATPTTIQLTPTQVKSLLGNNNVWADTGDIKDGKYVVQDYSDITSKVSEFAQHAITASKLGSSNVGSATQPIYLNGGTATACTYTLGKSVPSDAVFTDTKVTQTATDVSSNAEYEVLFSGTADDTTRTEGTRKTSLFTFNPQTNEVAAGHFAAKTDSPSGNKTANLLGYDIQLGGTSNTWDGTHTSLKDTITYLNSHFAPSAHDHNYLVSAGTNTKSTSSTAYALGSFNVRWFTETGKIPHQPSQWGFLLTVATGTNADENHQIFVEQSNGNLYHRGTNASSSSNPPAFKKILDSSNYTSYTRNSSGVIKVKSVYKTPTNAGTSLASPTPSIDTGYKFLCWLYVQSNGYIVGANYPGGAANPSATWWFANGYLANYGLTFYYLEIKDTI